MPHFTLHSYVLSNRYFNARNFTALQSAVNIIAQSHTSGVGWVGLFVTHVRNYCGRTKRSKETYAPAVLPLTCQSDLVLYKSTASQEGLVGLRYSVNNKNNMNRLLLWLS